jgi:hypothetical protein
MLKNVRHFAASTLPVVSTFLLLAACSSPPPAKQATEPPPGGPGPASTTSKHPLAKYIELSGFRLSESGAGKLKIKFAAINHSDADLGDLTVKVRLLTSASKPGDPPITEFEAKIPSLGPQEVKDITAEAITTLRIYELPDWQFLRADFDITSPAP